MKIKLISLFVVIVTIFGIVLVGMSMSPTKNLNDIELNASKKPVILLTIDSLMNESLQKAIQDGNAPALSFLTRKGRYIPEMISSYPTMSVAIDSTIVTGSYANQHRIPGLIWFNEKENRMISYGSGLREIWDNGVKNVAKDSVIRLNNEHLNPEINTIYEELTGQNIQAASINGLIYRGEVFHQLKVPKMLSFLKLLPKDIEVKGPTILSLGALAQYNPKNDKHKFIWRRMGVNNDFTINEVKKLIEESKLPSFTFGYLPDLDAKVHRNGLNEQNAIREVDESIQELLNLFPSWDEAIKEVTWIIMGDSAQSQVKADKVKGLIDVNELLIDYSFWSGKNEKGQIAIAINERMAYINLNDRNIELNSIIDTLKKDKRIGFIAWKDEKFNYVVSPEKESMLTFKSKGDSSDIYNQSWEIEGDLSLLDISISERGRIVYDSYPDGLARLNGALHSHDGRFIIVDAKPSYEFVEEHSHDHAGGGAHGSLHKVDSIVPLIIVGTNTRPKYNRLVDIKDWLIEIVQ